MRVNFFNEYFSEGSGIHAATQRWAEHLQKCGIDVVMNKALYDKGDFDILHVHSIGPKSIRAVKKAKDFNIPVVISAHTTRQDVRDSFRMANITSLFLKRYLKNFYNRADIILAPSPYTKSLLEADGVAAPIEVISNGVEIKKFSFDMQKRGLYREKFNIEKQERVVYCVGLVFLRKGIKTFVETAELLPHYKFIWFGKIMNRFMVSGVNHIIKSAPENCIFTGYVHDITAAHCAGDVFCFPSHEENQGIVVLEAASIGNPLVVRDIPVYEDWLEDSINCLKASSARMFADQIERLENDELRNNIKKNALLLAKKHRIEHSVNRLVEIYKTL